MKKLNLLLLTLLALWGATATADVVFDETNFPDENFREAIADAYWEDYDIRLNDGDILTDEMLNYELWLGADGYGIQSVQGIEYLAGLYSANLEMNQIEEIDLSNNHRLFFLGLFANPIISINLSGCTLLGELTLGQRLGQEGQLEELDLSDCVNLTKLTIQNEPLYSLNLSNNRLLLNLGLSNMPHLESIDFYTNSMIEELHFDNLEALVLADLSSLKQLKIVSLTNLPQLESINFYQPDYTNPEEIGLGIQGVYLQFNPLLTTLNLSGQNVLKSTILEGNALSYIDFSECSSLTDLTIFENSVFCQLNLSGCGNLQTIHVAGNLSDTLDLSDCVSIRELNISGIANKNNLKKIIGLDSSKPVMETLLLIDNHITSIDLDGFTALKYLDLHNTLINALDLSTNVNLQTLPYLTPTFSEVYDGRQIQVYSTDVNGERQYYIPLATTAAHKGIKDLIEQENNYEDEDTGFDWARVVTESITGATLGELDGEQVLWLDPTTTGATEGLHRMTYQYLTHCPNEQYATVEFYLDWAEATGMTGDVNGDGKVAIDDVTALIDYLLSGDATGINLDNADVNGEGGITIADVTALIDILLTGNN